MGINRGVSIRKPIAFRNGGRAAGNYSGRLSGKRPPSCATARRHFFKEGNLDIGGYNSRSAKGNPSAKKASSSGYMVSS